MLQALTPVVASSTRYLAPIMRSAMRDAIKHTTEAVIIYGGIAVVSIAGTGIYLGTRKVVNKVRLFRTKDEDQEQLPAPKAAKPSKKPKVTDGDLEPDPVPAE